MTGPPRSPGSRRRPCSSTGTTTPFRRGTWPNSSPCSVAGRRTPAGTAPAWRAPGPRCGSPEDWRFDQGKTRDEPIADLEEKTLLKRTATLADVGNVAALVASDYARIMTATAVNISCGAMVD